ncbi:MAG: nuclear transport factor 2 family protein [Gammaproteobacteria bacterium]|nr:nuclear transport factor 2 family protein [Gammaproteobacteria bacterium]
MPLSSQEMSDRFEIQDLIAEYCDIIDQGDFDRLNDVFTEDAFIDYSAMGGAAGSRDEIITFLNNVMPMFINTQHMISNYQIKIDGDTASGRIMCFNPMEISGNPVFFLGLWYVDEYRRTPDGWRISKRVEEKGYQFNAPEGIAAGS